MKTLTRNPVTTYGLIACLCTVSMNGAEAVAQNGVLDLRRMGSARQTAQTESIVNRCFVQPQQYDSRSVVSPSHNRHHGQPIQYETFDLIVHPGHHEAVTVYLHASTPYAITAQHNPGSVYWPTFPPPPDDVKLRVLRFWNGQLKMDRHTTGLGSASMSLQSTHWGVRPYVIKVYNHSSYAQRFLLTVSVQQVVQPLPQPIVQPLPRPRPVVRPEPRPIYRPLPVPITRPEPPPKSFPIVKPLPKPAPPKLKPPRRGSGKIGVKPPRMPGIKFPSIGSGPIRTPGIGIGIK